MTIRARSLGTLVGALLSVALLPIGLISVFQTLRAIEEARAVSEAALLGRTERAASAQRELIQTAFGAAEVLATSAARMRAARDGPPEAEECSALYIRFSQNEPDIAFAGYIDMSGTVRCASSGVGANLADDSVFMRAAEDPRPLVDVSPKGRFSGKAVVIVMQPVVSPEGGYNGFVAISIPNSTMAERSAFAGDGEIADGAEESDPLDPVSIVTFNDAGELLASDLAGGGADALLPRNVALADLAALPAHAFTGRNRLGQPRVFAVAPVVEGRVHAIGSRAPEGVFASPGFGRTLAVLFPTLMWLVGLAVAYFAVHRLAIRHIRRLAKRMRAFAGGQRDLPPLDFSDGPEELRAAGESFNKMADIITAEEQAQEDALLEKTVLLKEVHHRVKNNLQLIASIINMQARGARSPEARLLLRRIQERVIGLAAVHRNLYTAPALSSVRADTLVSELVERLAVASLPPGADAEVRTELQPTPLYPDQALPLSMLCAEAATNAVKHLGRGPDGAWIRVSLQRVDDESVAFEISNSVGESVTGAEDMPVDAGGLGNQLIEAFAAQLEGDLKVDRCGDRHVLRLRFPLKAFDPAA